MKRIVILGCENSHAHAFLKLLRENPAYAEIRVVGVYSEEPEPPRLLSETFGVPVMQTFDECVGQVDGVIVTARHGDNHLRYAAPYLPSGVPMFIDKPVTASEADAVALARAAGEHHVRLTGGSSCRHAAFLSRLKEDHETMRGGRTLGGLVRAPISLDNAYGGFSFYAQHLIEMVMEIFGRCPRSVRAARSGSGITVLFRYPGFDVTGLYVDSNYRYSAARFAEGDDRLGVCDIDQACFDREFSDFAALLDGAPMEGSYEDFIAPAFVLCAIVRALVSGGEEIVRYPTV